MEFGAAATMSDFFWSQKLVFELVERGWSTNEAEEEVDALVSRYKHEYHSLGCVLDIIVDVFNLLKQDRRYHGS